MIGKFWGIAGGIYQLVFETNTETGTRRGILDSIRVSSGAITHIDTIRPEPRSGYFGEFFQSDTRK